MKRKFVEWQAQDGETETALTDSQVSEGLFRNQFPESLDDTSWRAIKKALDNDSTKEEIIKDVLGCNNSIGEAYYDFLIKRFGNQ
jgi:hypothetical protein